MSGRSLEEIRKELDKLETQTSSNQPIQSQRLDDLQKDINKLKGIPEVKIEEKGTKMKELEKDIDLYRFQHICDTENLNKLEVKHRALIQEIQDILELVEITEPTIDYTSNVAFDPHKIQMAMGVMVGRLIKILQEDGRW